VTDAPMLTSPRYALSRGADDVETALAALDDGDIEDARHALREALQRFEAVD
jgi:hypothetical protein